jgi:hypothetical protein
MLSVAGFCEVWLRIEEIIGVSWIKGRKVFVNRAKMTERLNARGGSDVASQRLAANIRTRSRHVIYFFCKRLVSHEGEASPLDQGGKGFEIQENRHLIDKTSEKGLEAEQQLLVGRGRREKRERERSQASFRWEQCCF